jgi:mannose-6-phosphate isomerase-like protein (cupin superfamily)
MATPSIAAEAQSISHESVSEWLQTRPGERCLIRVSAADTDGAYSVVEIVSDPDDGTPIHVHQNEDEHFLILKGSARIVYGDKTFDASACRLRWIIWTKHLVTCGRPGLRLSMGQ